MAHGGAGRNILAVVAAVVGVVGGWRANPELHAAADGSPVVVSAAAGDPTTARQLGPGGSVPPERSGPGGSVPPWRSVPSHLSSENPHGSPSADARAYQAPAWDQALLPALGPDASGSIAPPISSRNGGTGGDSAGAAEALEPVTEESPALAAPSPTATRAPWAIPVRLRAQGLVPRPRPERDPSNAVTRLDPSAVPSSLLGITFAGPELTSAELLTGVRPDPNAPIGPTAWTVEIAYTSDHRFDEVVAAELLAKQARGFKVILRVDYGRKQPIPPPGDPEALREYAATFLRLYELTNGQIRYFLVGNEGNVDAAGDNPSRVTECLSGRNACAPEWYVQVYRAVRDSLRTGTNAYLIVGAPSPGGASDQMRWTDGADYLRSILGLLHPLEIDGVALHAYGGPADWPDHGLGQFTAQLSHQLRAVGEAGLGGTPVFLTEINQESAPSPEFLRGAHAWIDEHNRRSAVDVVAACWFVYHDADDEWRRYALEGRPEIMAALVGLAGLPPGR